MIEMRELFFLYITILIYNSQIFGSDISLQELQSLLADMPSELGFEPTIEDVMAVIEFKQGSRKTLTSQQKKIHQYLSDKMSPKWAWLTRSDI